MLVSDMKTKLKEILHDAKATIWTGTGHHLKKIEEHSKILDKILVQSNSITHYTNEFEKTYYGTCDQIEVVSLIAKQKNHQIFRLVIFTPLYAEFLSKNSLMASCTLPTANSSRHLLIPLPSHPFW